MWRAKLEQALLTSQWGPEPAPSSLAMRLAVLGIVSKGVSLLATI